MFLVAVGLPHCCPLSPILSVILTDEESKAMSKEREERMKVSLVDKRERDILLKDILRNGEEGSCGYCSQLMMDLHTL